MRLPPDARHLRSIVDCHLIVSENWLNYEYRDREITVATILDGYYEILRLRPYLCADPQITRSPTTPSSA
jgi:hypothetical protein